MQYTYSLNKCTGISYFKPFTFFSFSQAMFYKLFVCNTIVFILLKPVFYQRTRVFVPFRLVSFEHFTRLHVNLAQNNIFFYHYSFFLFFLLFHFCPSHSFSEFFFSTFCAFLLLHQITYRYYKHTFRELVMQCERNRHGTWKCSCVSECQTKCAIRFLYAVTIFLLLSLSLRVIPFNTFIYFFFSTQF